MAGSRLHFPLWPFLSKMPTEERILRKYLRVTSHILVSTLRLILLLPLCSSIPGSSRMTGTLLSSLLLFPPPSKTFGEGHGLHPRHQVRLSERVPDAFCAPRLFLKGQGQLPIPPDDGNTRGPCWGWGGVCLEVGEQVTVKEQGYGG